MTLIVNEIFIRKNIPDEISTGRLMLLNKKPSELPNIDNIRPINIGGPLIKVIEAITLKELKA